MNITATASGEPVVGAVIVCLNILFPASDYAEDRFACSKSDSSEIMGLIARTRSMLSLRFSWVVP
jgi:hypothetical protein